MSINIEVTNSIVQNIFLESYQSDWINSHPIFYNTKNLKVSTNINNVIEWGNFEFDNEGLHNYLKTGYLIFDKTVFKDVYRLPPNSQINIVINNGVRSFIITNYDDPVLKHLDGESTSEECLHKLETHINNFEICFSDKRYLLPLSGGHEVIVP